MSSAAAQDKATEIEQFGIEHIPEDKRHGSPGRIFTIWFAANLTIADYVIGVLCIQSFSLTLYQTIPVLIVGNVLGSLAGHPAKFPVLSGCCYLGRRSGTHRNLRARP